MRIGEGLVSFLFYVILLVRQGTSISPSRCEPITIPLCQGIQYNKTMFPNFLKHRSQEEAGLEVQQFLPLVNMKCSQYLKFFLCSVYVPICSDKVSSDIPPCRNLCEAARIGCLPLMHQFGFQWPVLLECTNYPEMGKGSLCVGMDLSKSEPDGGRTPGVGGGGSGGGGSNGEEGDGMTNGESVSGKNGNIDLRKGTSIPPSRCEPITIPLCQGIQYNKTMFPNLLKHRSQEEAGLEVQQFLPFVKVKCSQYLKFFLCSVYVPICSDKVSSAIPPCRNLCEAARIDCLPLMHQFGFQWPVLLECTNYPEMGKGSLCVGMDLSKSEPDGGRTPGVGGGGSGGGGSNGEEGDGMTNGESVSGKNGNIDLRKGTSIPPSRCEPITIPLCQGIQYNKTMFPNLLKHRSQEEAGLEVQQFLPFVKVKCSQYLKFFLCSVYVPICSDKVSSAIPPCRNLCEAARIDCLPLMHQFGFQWPVLLECTNYPEMGKGSLCVGMDLSKSEPDGGRTPGVGGGGSGGGGSNGEEGHGTTHGGSVSGKNGNTDLRKGTSISPSRCEPITIPLCQGIQYNKTMFPNFLKHRSQEEAGLEVQQFLPLVNMKCSQYLKFFLCSVYVPICSDKVSSAIPPCRNLCEAARLGCLPLMHQFGFQWPVLFDCTNYPEMGKGSLCVGKNFSKSEQDGGRIHGVGGGGSGGGGSNGEEGHGTTHGGSVSGKNGTTDLRKGTSISPSRCEPITIPLCQGIQYNKTMFPNFLKHRSQEEAGLEVQQFLPLVNMKCSQYLKFFLCSVYVPICSDKVSSAIPPCRNLCEAARIGCLPLMHQFGFQWPVLLECTNYPEMGKGSLCVGMDLSKSEPDGGRTPGVGGGGSGGGGSNGRGEHGMTNGESGSGKNGNIG